MINWDPSHEDKFITKTRDQPEPGRSKLLQFFVTIFPSRSEKYILHDIKNYPKPTDKVPEGRDRELFKAISTRHGLKHVSYWLIVVPENRSILVVPLTSTYHDIINDIDINVYPVLTTPQISKFQKVWYLFRHPFPSNYQLIIIDIGANICPLLTTSQWPFQR